MYGRQSPRSFSVLHRHKVQDELLQVASRRHLMGCIPGLSAGRDLQAVHCLPAVKGQAHSLGLPAVCGPEQGACRHPRHIRDGLSGGSHAPVRRSRNLISVALRSPCRSCTCRRRTCTPCSPSAWLAQVCPGLRQDIFGPAGQTKHRATSRLRPKAMRLAADKAESHLNALVAFCPCTARQPDGNLAVI